MSAVLPRYPVYIPSKGRSDCCHTARFLAHDGVPFRLVVEPQEREKYAREFGEERLLLLPWDNPKGAHDGLLKARNWIMEHAIREGHVRHWQLDDNILGVWRRWKTRKIRCESGPALRAVEDFSDRYENVAISGLNYYMFSINKLKQPPFCLNVHVYSCTLVLNEIPFRWRLPYNDDVDFCLQALAAGWCTVLFNAFLAWKMNTMTVKGGNTDRHVADGRLKMARELERAWPGVVTTERRFQRPQHVIRDSWRKFDTPLRRKPGVDFDALARAGANEYGLELHLLREMKNDDTRRLYEGVPMKKAGPAR